jgi:ubiquinone/menaquinone biosynthesis C-methylase UbiE
MGFYGRFILPWILDCAMKDEAASERRAALIPRASGSVLEIGIGSGLNLPYYTAAVTRLHGIDASPEMLAMARKKIGRVPFPVELTCDSAEHLRVGDASFDTVVVTWALCSIPNPLRALHEMRRVLKPDGRLLFVEHGASPDRNVLAWQRRLNPIWRRIGGGCHLDREIDSLITTAGFRIEQMQNLYLKGPRPLTYTFEGAAYSSGGGCTTTAR